MPIATGALIGGAALVALIAGGGKKKAQQAQPAPGQAPGGTTFPGFDPSAREALFEVREGIQFWRKQVADGLYAMWGAEGLVSTSQPPDLPSGAYYLLVAPKPVDAASAQQAIVGAVGQGLIVLAHIGCSIPQGSWRMLAFLPGAGSVAPAAEGGDWGVFAVGAIAPGTPPYVPGGGAPPGGPLPGFPSIPGGGTYPPSGGAQWPGTEPPPLDPISAKVEEMIRDPNASPEALEEAADLLESQGRKSDAQKLRARAAELRAEQQAADMARGSSLFTIRSGDLPYKLAQYYTGDSQKFREIPPLNQDVGMRVVHKNGGTFLEPWRGTIKLPLSWKVWSKPLPPTASGQAPVPQAPEAASILGTLKEILAS